MFMEYFIIAYLALVVIATCLIAQSVHCAPTDIELWGEETD